MLHLTPKPDDPPKEVWYYRDGATIGWFNIGERPDDGTEFLIPALEEAGFFDTTLHEDEVLITLRVLQEHFGLSLPRQQILTGRLPPAVTAKTRRRKTSETDKPFTPDQHSHARARTLLLGFASPPPQPSVWLLSGTGRKG